MKNTQQIKIDETEIENAEQLKHFEDSATHRVETIFYAKFFEPDFLYKTHLYIGKIRFLPNLMIIDIEEERHGIYESPEKPVSTEFNLYYQNYCWRGEKTMSLTFGDDE